MNAVAARLMKGTFASEAEVEDDGLATIIYTGGSHKDHKASICTKKHNAGAYTELIKCACGNTLLSLRMIVGNQQIPQGESGDAHLDFMWKGKATEGANAP